MARNQRSTSKNTRSEGAAGRGGAAGRSGAAGRGGAAGRSGAGRGGAAGRGSKKAADWGGYFGAKNGQGSRGSRSAQGARAAQGARGQRGAGGQRGASAGRPGNKKPATDLIEGRRAVAEALTVGIPLKNALVQAASGQKDQEIEALARQLEQEGIPVERVAKPVLDSLSSHGAHQGVIVRTQPFAYANLSEIIQLASSLQTPALPELALEHTRLPLEPCFTCQLLRFLICRALLKSLKPQVFGHVALPSTPLSPCGRLLWEAALHLSWALKVQEFLALCSRSAILRANFLSLAR